MGVTIVHTADLHLDSPFSLSSPAKAEMRKTELRGTFTSAILEAKRIKADLFLIAGDLFDSEYAGRDTAELIINQIASFPECRFFISPGNHDPFNDASVYASVKFPSNCHVFREKETVEIPELGVNVCGVGFTSAAYNTSPVMGFGELDHDRINILVCHGDVGVPTSKNGPITRSEIAKSGFDYIALGHIHAPSGVLREGDTYFAYPGCIEGRSYDEPGEHGIIVGTVGKGKVDLEEKILSKRRYELCSVDLSGITEKYEALDIIRSKLRPYGEHTAIRVKLTGTVKTPFVFSANEIGTPPEFPFEIELIDTTIPEIDFTLLEQDTSICGVFYKKMLKKLDECDPDSEEYRINLGALKYGITVLSDRSLTDIITYDK